MSLREDMAENENAERAVPNAASNREAGEPSDAVAAIRRDLVQAKMGVGRSVAEVFDDLERAA